MDKRRFPIVAVVSVLVFVILAAALLGSASAINRKAREQSYRTLEYNAEQLAEDVQAAAVQDSTILAVIARAMAAADSEEARIETMRAYRTYAVGLTRLAYLDPQSRFHWTDGTSFGVGESFRFAIEAENAPYISDKLPSLRERGDSVILNAVPIVRDGETVGILYGVISLGTLAKQFTTDLYGGSAYLYLIDGTSGDFLLDTWNVTLGNFSRLEPCKMPRGYTYDETRSNLRRGVAGSFAFTVKTSDSVLYMYYQPTGINNWSVAISVKESIALAEAGDIQRSLYVTICIVTATLLVYMSFLVTLLLRSMRTIHKLGMEDQTTGLQNRNAYDRYINETRDIRFDAVTCIFIDVNGLHEINNKYGHRVGDQMLRIVADALKDEFQSRQIYRIGGDEFTVFVTDRDADDCKEMVRRVREQVTARGYSIAVGLAHRRQELGVSRITQEADERMLADKRAYYSGLGYASERIDPSCNTKGKGEPHETPSL